MAKYRHFELNEFLESETAKKNKLDNFPTFEIVEHIQELIEKFLEPLRTALNRPIVIGSGYRCARLNLLVGGSLTSAHQVGYAADLSCPQLPFYRFRDFVLDWVKKNNIKFDQIIVETEKSTGKQWLHIGLKNRSGQQRCQILNIEK